MPMENKERVEVLKGSSALYYGFTSPAGVVNLVTKRAGPEPVMSVAVSGNEFGSYQGHFDVGRQFENGKYGMRFNAMSAETRNAIDDFKGRRQLVAGALDVRPSDALTIKFDFEDAQKAVIEQASVSVPAAVNGVITLPRVPDPTKLLSGTWANTSGKISNVVGRADYFINPDWAVMVEWGQARTDRERRASSQWQVVATNATTIANSIATGDGNLRMSLTRRQFYINDNVRAELAGHFVTGILDHEVTAGFMENQRYQNGPSQQVFTIAQNLYNPRVLPESFLTANLTISPQDVTDRGIYALERMRIGEKWQVLLGARRTDYTNISATGTYAVKNTSPSYALLFKPWKHTTLYASYIEGLEEGGTAPLSTNNPGQVLPAGRDQAEGSGGAHRGIRGTPDLRRLFQDRARERHHQRAELLRPRWTHRVQGLRVFGHGRDRQGMVHLPFGNVPRREADERAEHRARRETARQHARADAQPFRGVPPGYRSRPRRQCGRVLHWGPPRE
jgi:iron complex outermembrane receptor protein